MSTAIEWSLGLPCPDQRDAIVASVVDGGPAPANAATTDHLRRCPACRAFRESLRTQRVLVRRIAEQKQQEEARKQARQRELRAGFREWVDEELKVRGERELARAMWNCAYAIFRLEPSVARGTHHESGDPDRSGDPEYSQSIAALDSLLNWILGRSTSTLMATRCERIRGILRSLDAAELSSGNRRVALIHSLLDSSEQLSPSMRSPTATTRASVEWFHGNQQNVKPLLDRALQLATTPSQRGHSVANLAVWCSSLGSITDAIEIGLEAIRVAPLLAYPRVNLALWLTASGDHRTADRFFCESVAIAGQTRFLANWPWTLVADSLRRCIALTGGNARDRSRAIDSMWIAYHRWIGSTSSRLETHSAAQARIESLAGPPQ